MSRWTKVGFPDWRGFVVYGPLPEKALKMFIDAIWNDYEINLYNKYTETIDILYPDSAQKPQRRQQRQQRQRQQIKRLFTKSGLGNIYTSNQ